MSVTIAVKRSEQPFTYRDYRSWPDDERWELIDGVAYDMCAAPSRRHQEISMALSRRFANFFFGKKCRSYHAPFDVILTESDDDDLDDAITVVEPDLAVVCDERKLIDQGCRGAPDLVVEIISPYTSKKDQREKFNLYERVGVREYWIIHPADQVAVVYTRGASGKLDTETIYTLKDRHPSVSVVSSIFPELEVPLAELFDE